MRPRARGRQFSVNAGISPIFLDILVLLQRGIALNLKKC
jgi:hypothetical protein